MSVRESGKRSGFLRFLSGVMVTVNAAVSLWLVAASYGGCVDPRSWAFPSVVGMTLPIVVPIAVLVLVMDLVWWRKQALFAGLCMIVSFPAVLDTFPLNMPSGRLPEKDVDRSFTLMTYNVILYQDMTGEYPGDINPAINYILRMDPDVVCLQEASFFSESSSMRITREQVDSIRSRYPYVSVNGTGQAAFSKFPMRMIHTGFSSVTPGSGDVAVYELTVKGQRVALFNVHLNSIGLTQNDKELYGELTHLRAKRRIREVKSSLIAKLESSSVDRASQIDDLLRMISKYGGENSIICGDFNDVPGCYGLHQLAEARFHEVYPEKGLLYMPTYNRNRLLFTIDHVLYRGNLKPFSIERGDLKSSDHYPLLTTFLMEPSK